MTSANPLLKTSPLPHQAPLLTEIRPEHFLPAVAFAIAAAKKEIDAIKNNPEAPTFENTVEALEAAGRKLAQLSATFNIMAGVKCEAQTAKIGESIGASLSAHAHDIINDAALFNRVKTVHATDGATLDEEQKTLLERTYKNFIRNGAELSAEKKKELKKIDAEILRLTGLYQGNILTSAGDYKKIIDDESLLAGVPEIIKLNYKNAALQKGMSDKWLVELSPPPREILQYADNRDLRREVYIAMNSIACDGPHDNRRLAHDIASLRHRKANILGHGNYAEMALSENMAKTPATVMEFLRKENAECQAQMKGRVREVAALAIQVDGIAKLEPWDFAYYHFKLQQKKFGATAEDFRPHFPFSAVLEGMFRHAEKLFGIHVTEETAKYQTYDPSVKVYEVTDKKTGETLGILYTDYQARPGSKADGFWMEAFRERAGKDSPIVINVCNFGGGKNGEEVSLSLWEILSVFHEFGHALHSLLARGNYPSQNGTNVARDFLEIPSQLQEFWLLQPEVLQSLSRHCKTGKPLSLAEAKRAIDIQEFDHLHAGTMHNFWSLLDMKWYTTNPADIADADVLEDEVIAESGLDAVFPRLPGTNTSAAFDHIFGAYDYAANFYVYNFSRDLAQQKIFNIFMEKGLYHQDTAQSLRDNVYAKGGNVKPEKIISAMKGLAA